MTKLGKIKNSIYQILLPDNNSCIGVFATHLVMAQNSMCYHKKTIINFCSRFGNGSQGGIRVIKDFSGLDVMVNGGQEWSKMVKNV
jgi:hypothetical protein